MSTTEHILVVDDEVNIRVTLRALLERGGYRVTVAAGGREACALLDEHDFDLMMVDLKMPGVDGMQVVERARDRRPGMVVIVLTGHGSLDSAIAGMRHGIFDYLLKTTEPAQVLERIRAGLLARARELRRRTLIPTLDAAVNELRGGDERGAAASTERTIVLGGLLAAWLGSQAAAATLPVEAVGYTMVATLAALGVLEHLLMVVPLPPETLWGRRPAPPRGSAGDSPP